MKNYYLFLFVLFLSILISCKDKKVATDAKTDIHVDVSTAQIRNYEPLLDSVTYIPLETKSECLIGQIGKMYVTPAYIIIFDSKQTEILLFDRKGKFVRKIGTKGRGPQEYLFFNEICYNAKDQLIYAHERYLDKMFVYNLEGELLKQIKSNYQFNSFCKTEAGFWIYSCFKDNNPEGFNLMLLDESMQHMKIGMFPQNPAFINVTFDRTFCQDTNGITYFAYPTSNIIYRLSGENVVADYRINFGEKNMQYSELAKLDNREAYDKIVNSKRFLGDIANLFICQNCLLFSFNESGFNTSINSYTASLNTSTSKISIFNGFAHFLSVPVSYTLLGTTTDALIYSIPTYSLNEKAISILQKHNIHVNADDNPILAFFKLKAH